MRKGINHMIICVEKLLITVAGYFCLLIRLFFILLPGPAVIFFH
jgi:hypothetical protein